MGGRGRQTRRVVWDILILHLRMLLMLLQLMKLLLVLLGLRRRRRLLVVVVVLLRRVLLLVVRIRKPLHLQLMVLHGDISKSDLLIHLPAYLLQLHLLLVLLVLLLHRRPGVYLRGTHLRHSVDLSVGDGRSLLTLQRRRRGRCGYQWGCWVLWRGKISRGLRGPW